MEGLSLVFACEGLSQIKTLRMPSLRMPSLMHWGSNVLRKVFLSLFKENFELVIVSVVLPQVHIQTGSSQRRASSNLSLISFVSRLLSFLWSPVNSLKMDLKVTWLATKPYIWRNCFLVSLLMYLGSLALIFSMIWELSLKRSAWETSAGIFQIKIRLGWLPGWSKA